MKKRVLSALLVLCMACSMVSTVWATETNATSGAPEPASQTLNLDNEQSGNESGADSTGAPSDSTDSTAASSDSTSSGSSSAASDTASDAMSDVTSGEGDESAASSDSTAASDSTSSSSSASSDSSDSNADDPNAASSDVTGDESGTGAEEERDPAVEQPSAGSGITVTDESGDVPMLLAGNENGTPITLQYNNQTLEVYLIDTEGNPVPAGDSGPIEVADNQGEHFGGEHWGSGTSINEIINQLGIGEDYTYLKTVAKPNVNQAVDAVYQSNNEIERLAFCPNHDCWEYNRGSRRNGWNSVTKNDADNKVYLIFDKLEPSTADITVTKTVTGFNNLTDEEKQNYSVAITVTGPSSDSQQQALTAAQLGLVNSDGTYNDTGTAQVTFNDFSFGNYNQSGQFTVTETPTVTADNVTVSGNNVTQSQENAYVATFTVNNNGSRTVRFENTYNRRNNPTIVSANVTPGKSATKVSEDSDDYTLELNVSGDRGSSTAKAAVDVIFVLDVSGSMREDILVSQGQYPWDPGEYDSKINVVKDAITTVSNNLSANDNLYTRYALVTFSGAKGGKNETSWDDAEGAGWFESASALQNSLPEDNDQDVTGGTNYQAGLYKAKDYLDDSDATKVVIFLSDGDPTYWYDTDGTTAGEGNNDITDRWGDVIGFDENNYNSSLNAAKTECGTLDADYFYTVGVGYSSSALSDLVTAATKVPADNKGSYGGTDAGDLTAALNQIRQDITFFAAHDVVLHDTLSQYAEIVANGTGDNVGQVVFTVELEQADSEAEGGYRVIDSQTNLASGATSKAFSTTIAAESEGGQDQTTQFVFKPVYSNGVITVEIASVENGGTYELAPGYRYTVKTTIRPSSTAYETETYNAVGDANTGTHAGQDGFYSNNNDQAYVSFVTTNNPDGKAPFPKPVIQVTEEQVGSLTLTKQLTGDTDNIVPEDTEFTFTITIPAGENNANAKSYGAEYTGAPASVTAHSGDVTFTVVEGTTNVSATVNLYAGESVTINGLPAGITPTITEESASWYTTSGLENISAISNGSTVQVTCTNAVNIDALTLEKQVVNGAEADTDGNNVQIATSQQFKFQVAAGNDVKDIVGSNTFGDIPFTNGVAEVTVTAGSSVTIQGLPEGTYTVTEIDLNTVEEIIDTSGNEYYISNSTTPTEVVTVGSNDNTATLVNTYLPYRTVKITKQVDGEMGDTTHPFNFTTSVKRGSSGTPTNIVSETTNVTVNGETEQVSAALDKNENLDEAGQAKFVSGGYTLADEESITISKLKDGDVLVINELDGASQGYTVTYTENTETIDNNNYVVEGNGDIEVKNYRPVVAPTGLESNHTTPYVLMITAAGMAGLALIGGIVARRIRRRRQE